MNFSVKVSHLLLSLTENFIFWAVNEWKHGNKMSHNRVCLTSKYILKKNLSTNHLADVINSFWVKYRKLDRAPNDNFNTSQ